MIFTKEQLISYVRQSINNMKNMKERTGGCCKEIREVIEQDLEVARIALEALEAEQVKNGWISCSDRMPEQFKTVLAYTKFGEIWTGTYDTHCNFYCDNILVEGVTHWMPIPELPEE